MSDMTVRRDAALTQDPGSRRGRVAARMLRMLIIGFAVSSAGSYLNMVALNIFVYQVTRNAAFVGVFIALRLAAGFGAGLPHRLSRHSWPPCRARRTSCSGWRTPTGNAANSNPWSRAR